MYCRFNRCIVGLTGECNFFTFHEKSPLWTTEPMRLTGASSVQLVYVFSSVFICQCTDVYNFRSVGSTAECKTLQNCSKSMHRRMQFLQRRFNRCIEFPLSWFFLLRFLHGLFNSCPLDRRGFRALPWDPRGTAPARPPSANLSSLCHHLNLKAWDCSS